MSSVGATISQGVSSTLTQAAANEAALAAATTALINQPIAKVAGWYLTPAIIVDSLFGVLLLIFAFILYLKVNRQVIRLMLFTLLRTIAFAVRSYIIQNTLVSSANRDVILKVNAVFSVVGFVLVVEVLFHILQYQFRIKAASWIGQFQHLIGLGLLSAIVLNAVGLILNDISVKINILSTVGVSIYLGIAAIGVVGSIVNVAPLDRASPPTLFERGIVLLVGLLVAVRSASVGYNYFISQTMAESTVYITQTGAELLILILFVLPPITAILTDTDTWFNRSDVSSSSRTTPASAAKKQQQQATIV